MGTPGDLWKLEALIPALIPAQPGASPPGPMEMDGWACGPAVCVCARACGCARMAMSVCQGTCAGAGRLRPGCRSGLCVPVCISHPGTVCERWGGGLSALSPGEMLGTETAPGAGGGRSLSPRRPSHCSSYLLCAIRQPCRHTIHRLALPSTPEAQGGSARWGWLQGLRAQQGREGLQAAAASAAPQTHKRGWRGSRQGQGFHLVAIRPWAPTTPVFSSVGWGQLCVRAVDAHVMPRCLVSAQGVLTVAIPLGSPGQVG